MMKADFERRVRWALGSAASGARTRWVLKFCRSGRRTLFIRIWAGERFCRRSGILSCWALRPLFELPTMNFERSSNFVDKSFSSGVVVLRWEIAASR